MSFGVSDVWWRNVCRPIKPLIVNAELDNHAEFGQVVGSAKWALPFLLGGVGVIEVAHPFLAECECHAGPLASSRLADVPDVELGPLTLEPLVCIVHG